MFSESAEFYDLIYTSFKDYRQEARELATMLRQASPECRTVLDVACGTGEHARYLAAEHGFLVDGLDLEEAFVRIAAAKLPAGRFCQADMTDFNLDRRYDAILCLFSAIGYVRTLASVQRSLDCFRKHLNATGVVILEPWFGPGVLVPERRDTRTVEAPDLRIVRESHVEVEGRMSRIKFDYEIHQAGTLRHMSEVHEMGLFTIEELLRCFEAAGLEAAHQSEGLFGRGVFIARVPGARR